MFNRKTLTAVALACGLLMTPALASADTKVHKKVHAKKTVKVKVKAHAKQTQRVFNDATRLASLLHDAQTTVSVNSAVWRTIANEANTLANRIYANTAHNATARASARDLRTHVRAFRREALEGNAVAARRHATEAMPSLHKLIDWSN